MPQSVKAKLLTVLALAPSALANASVDDLARAKRSFPRGHVRGENPLEIRQILNKALKDGSVAMPKHAPCEDFTYEDLVALQKAMVAHLVPDLYAAHLRTPRHESEESLMRELVEEADYVSKNPEVVEALRDGKCAEIAMQWVHHLSDEGRVHMGDKRMPLLSHKGTAEHGPDLIHGRHNAVAQRLTSQITCQNGHDAKAEARGTWDGFPTWPFEVDYNATGYGQYPFWGGESGTLKFPPSPSPPTTGAPIHTYYSAVLNAERFDHNGVCTITTYGFTSDGPCTHLMLGSKYAYLFDQAQTSCCITSTPNYACHMTTMPRDFPSSVFEKSATGTVDTLENYVSETGYYNGTVKRYSMHLTTPSDFWFWYITDTDGKPIEQGEGACNMYESDSSRSRDCSGPPKMLWHQYNPSTFKETTLDPSVFAVPDICKSATRTCEVNPTKFCGDSQGRSETVVV